MADWGTAAGSILAWFSPEERMKQKRIKRDALNEERQKLIDGACTLQSIKRVEKIDEELKKINRDLGN